MNGRQTVEVVSSQFYLVFRMWSKRSTCVEKVDPEVEGYQIIIFNFWHDNSLPIWMTESMP